MVFDEKKNHRIPEIFAVFRCIQCYSSVNTNTQSLRAFYYLKRVKNVPFSRSTIHIINFFLTKSYTPTRGIVIWSYFYLSQRTKHQTFHKTSNIHKSYNKDSDNFYQLARIPIGSYQQYHYQGYVLPTQQQFLVHVVPSQELGTQL